MYLLAPFTWIPAIKHTKSRGHDKNCIKKEGIYMSGNFSCHNSYTISVKKAKLLSKKMGITFNDLIMGLTSKVLKQYFVSKGDITDEITAVMPFSFRSIPQKKEEYTYGNKFVGLTVYLKLIDDFKSACHSVS
jgi:NRPS condensation-like uncharacterized protein